jgi:hypothetical protein
LNQKVTIEQLVPDGLLISRKWLIGQGFPETRIDHIVRSGKLSVVAKGVYRKPGQSLKWQAVVVSLQSRNMGSLDLTVGGLTALEMQGLGHYLKLSSERVVDLYGRSILPKWVDTISPESQFRHFRKNLFSREKLLPIVEITATKTSVVESNNPLAKAWRSVNWGSWDWPLTFSTPELAILEVLAGVPGDMSFEDCDLLFEGLANLSPRRLTMLLMLCKSVKVKRLFFWFAERHQHSWLNSLDQQEFDLGSGKRVLVANGKLDNKYLITVPGKMHGSK